MLSFLQHFYYQLLYRLTDRLSPVNEALWSPVGHELMGRGHMFRDGRVAIPDPVPSMNGYAIVFIKDFNLPGCKQQLDFLSYLLVRNAIVVVVDLNMVIDIDQELFPFGVVISINR